ncbi:MAG TPA: LysR family transcriptional regulator [Solirubrobacterales bacterium]|nr:LysR family transcriptional regulator [Solirubrobacterales bacterium]
MTASLQLTIRHLRAFVALAEDLHFGRAAASLHLTSSALSQSLSQLEMAVGAKLIHRTTRQVELTAAGRETLEGAKAALAAFDEAIGQMERVGRGEVGELTVGYVIGAVLDLMPTVIRAFERSTPGARLELREYDFTQPAAGLDSGEVDVAFVRPPLSLEGLAYLDLLDEPRVACMPTGHPLAARKQVSMRDLATEPMVAAPAGDPVWRDYWLLVPERGGESPNVVVEAATFEAELQAVAAGRGISITGLTAARFYTRPGVTFVPVSDVAPCKISLAWWPERASGAAERLVEVAKAQQAEFQRTSQPMPVGDVA